MISHLQIMGDPIVSKFRQSELNPILMENAYHSPEESEEEPDNGKELNNSKRENRIVIRDLQWRSDSVSIIK
jgi:hypothetical protein